LFDEGKVHRVITPLNRCQEGGPSPRLAWGLNSTKARGTKESQPKDYMGTVNLALGQQNLIDCLHHDK